MRAEDIAKIDAAATGSLTNGVTGTVVSIVDPERGTFLKAYGAADTAGPRCARTCTTGSGA